MLLKLYLYNVLFLVCTTEGHFMDLSLGCVCGVDYYQTAVAIAEDHAVCTACPSGSTTNGETNSDACGQYDKIVIPIPQN